MSECEATVNFVIEDFNHDEEEWHSAQVQVTMKEALTGPDAVRFMEADKLEKLQLEGHKTW